MSDDMKRELAEIKNAVNALQTESLWVRKEFKGVHEELGQVNGRLTNLETTVRTIAISQVHMQSDIKSLQENMATKADIRTFTTYFESFAAKLDAFGRQLTFLNHGQMQHTA